MGASEKRLLLVLGLLSKGSLTRDEIYGHESIKEHCKEVESFMARSNNGYDPYVQMDRLMMINAHLGLGGSFFKYNVNTKDYSITELGMNRLNKLK